MRGVLILSVLGFCSFNALLAHGATKLNAPLSPGGYVASFQIAADGRHVVYSTIENRSGQSVRSLYSVSLDALSTPITLSDYIVGPGVGSTGEGWEISPDSRWVVFQSRYRPDGVEGLFSVPIDGSSPAIDLDGGLYRVGGKFEISPDSRYVVSVRGEPDAGMFSTSIDGTSGVTSLDSLSLGSLGGWQISADSRRVVYKVYASGALYSQPLDGSSPAIRLDNDAPGSIENMYSTTPDGSRVLYSVRAGNSVWDIYSVPADGSGPPDLLSEPSLSSAPRYELTPDGRCLVYARRETVNDPFDLFARPVDGSQPSRVVGFDALLGYFQISPDSQHVVFPVYQVDSGTNEFFTASLTSDDPALQLIPPVGEGEFFVNTDFTPDADRLIYRGRLPNATYSLSSVTVHTPGKIFREN